jgi:hypothetical protein
MLFNTVTTLICCCLSPFSNRSLSVIDQNVPFTKTIPRVLRVPSAIRQYTLFHIIRKTNVNTIRRTFEHDFFHCSIGWNCDRHFYLELLFFPWIGSGCAYTTEYAVTSLHALYFLCQERCWTDGCDDGPLLADWYVNGVDHAIARE